MAKGRWFQVELIVFAQYMPNTELFDQVVSEIEWPDRLAGLSGNSFLLSELKGQPVPYARIKGQDKILHSSYAALSGNRLYQPLLHVSWLQLVSQNSISPAVKLQSPDGRVNGFVRVQRGHLLHLLVDMEYRPEQIDSVTNLPKQRPLIFHLKEKRRMKYREIHYLDHPKFGIIATLKPVNVY